MKQKALGALVLGLLLVGHAHAQSFFLSGNDILRDCASTATFVKQARCTGYIEGIADYLEMLRALMGAQQCLPPHTEASQVVDAFVAYLRKHPESRQQSAASLGLLAITSTWKCE